MLLKSVMSCCHFSRFLLRHISSEPSTHRTRTGQSFVHILRCRVSVRSQTTWTIVMIGSSVVGVVVSSKMKKKQERGGEVVASSSVVSSSLLASSCSAFSVNDFENIIKSGQSVIVNVSMDVDQQHQQEHSMSSSLSLSLWSWWRWSNKRLVRPWHCVNDKCWIRSILWSTCGGGSLVHCKNLTLV